MVYGFLQGGPHFFFDTISAVSYGYCRISVDAWAVAKRFNQR
jgi:hypothetical protein